MAYLYRKRRSPFWYVEYLDWRTTFKKRTGKVVGRNTSILELIETGL